MRITKLEGQLEIHHERGVIYFHDNAKGWTTLRICGLPPIPDVSERQLDVSHMTGTDWGPITPEELLDRGRSGFAVEKRLKAQLEKEEKRGQEADSSSGQLAAGKTDRRRGDGHQPRS